MPKVLVASLPPYTVVDTPLPTCPSSKFQEDRFVEDRFVEERRESLRAMDRRDDRSSLVLEAPFRERVSLRVLERSWLMRSEGSR